MKWIEYDYVCNADKGINLHKKVEYNEANLAIAEVEACNGEYTITEDSENIEVKPVAIELGGTGANTVEGAQKNLGIVTPKVSMNAPSATDDIAAGYCIGQSWIRPNYTLHNLAYNKVTEDFVATACIATKIGQTVAIAGNGDDKVISVALEHGSATGWLYAIITPDGTASSAKVIVGNDEIALVVGEANVVKCKYTGETVILEIVYETANIASTGTAIIDSLTIVDEVATLLQVDESCRDVADETIYEFVAANAPFYDYIIAASNWKQIKNGAWHSDGSLPQLIVYAFSGADVTCVKDNVVLTVDELSSRWVFDIPEKGVWSICLKGKVMGTVDVSVERVYHFVAIDESIAQFVYLTLVGNVNTAMVEAAFGKGNEDRVNGIGISLALYMHYKSSSLVIDEKLPKLTTCNTLQDILRDLDVQYEILNYTTLYNYLRSVSYANSTLFKTVFSVSCGAHMSNGSASTGTLEVTEDFFDGSKAMYMSVSCVQSSGNVTNTVQINGVTLFDARGGYSRKVIITAEELARYNITEPGSYTVRCDSRISNSSHSGSSSVSIVGFKV